MILVFILLTILIIIISFIFLILLSTFRIKIKDLEITNIKEKKEIDYAIIFSFYLGNKIKWLSFQLNDEKMKKTYTRMHLERIDFKKIEKNLKWEDFKIIKHIQAKFSYFNLKMKLGTESPVATAFIIAILSSLISILLPLSMKKIEEENCNYEIEPIYENKNLYKIKFNCIIQVKMVHIINVIYIFLKKGRSDLNERTTSNRRAYGYSHE